MDDVATLSDQGDAANRVLPCSVVLVVRSEGNTIHYLHENAPTPIVTFLEQFVQNYSGIVLLFTRPADMSTEAVGFVQPGQAVKVKLAAYPFQKYEMIDGVVQQISADASDTRTRFDYRD